MAVDKPASKTAHRTRRRVLFLVYILMWPLGCELIAQVSYHIQYGKWIWSAAVQHIRIAIPVADRRQYSLAPNFQDGAATTDANGFRLPSPPAGTPLELVCAGDSVPYGSGVSDEQTYCADLAALGLTTLNAGVPSYNLRQTFDRLRIDVLPRYPDVKVITIQASNDAQLVGLFGKDWTPDSTSAMDRNSIGPFPSALLFFYNTSLSPVRIANNLPVEAMLNNERQVLRENLTFLRDRHIKVILIDANTFEYQTANTSRNAQLPTWATSKPWLDDYGDLNAKYNAVLKQVAAEFDNVTFLDVIAPFDQQDRQKLFIDQIHLTPDGDRLMATLILRQWAELEGTAVVF